MTIHARLDDLRRRGVRLRMEGDRLVATPAAALSSADADWIRSNKPAIRAAIEAAEPSGRRLPLRSHCISCGSPLDERSAVRCPACVEAAYRERDRQRASEGPDPPIDAETADPVGQLGHASYPRADETERSNDGG